MFEICIGSEHIHGFYKDKKRHGHIMDSHSQINLIQMILGYPPTTKSVAYDPRDVSERILDDRVEEQRFIDTAESLGISEMHLTSFIYRDLGTLAKIAEENNQQILFLIKEDKYEGTVAF